MKVKKLSKGILLGFFFFKFVFGTSFAPIIVNAQEVEDTREAETVSGVEDSKNQEEETNSMVNSNNGGGNNQDMMCPDHSSFPKIENPNFGGYNTIVVDGFTLYAHFSVDGKTVSFKDSNGDPIVTTFCIKAATNNSGQQTGTSGTVTWTNNGGQIPEISHVVIYSVEIPENPSCDASVNLITNGGFESPNLGSSNWNVYTNLPGWTIEWQPGSGNGGPAKAEIQKINTPNEGNQYLELDSDFDGPGGSINNESASTNISQTINTVPGQKYKITYYYSARPGYGYDDNKVGLYIDGYPWDLSVTANGVGKSDAVWYLKTNNFTANSTSHTITFADIGTSNSFGMFLDNIKVNCVDGPVDPKNTPPVINADPVEVCLPFDLMTGVTATDVEDGSIVATVVEDEQYTAFLTGAPGTYTITYQAVDSQKAVTTKTRIVTIKENCDEDPEGPSCDVSTIWARIVITDVQSTGMGNMTNNIYLGGSNPGNVVSSGVWFPLSAISDSNINGYQNVPGLAVQRTNDNKIVVHLHGSLPQNQGKESVDGYIEFFNGTPTLVVGATGQNKLEDATYPHEDLVWIVSDRSYFDLAVSTANDRFTTTYIYSLDEDCDDGDDDDDNGGCIGEDCNTDDDDDDDDNGGNNGGNSSSSGSRGGRGGGFIPEGEVLGATDSVCVQFTQYHDTGSRKSEVVALQTFLNEYMNAGLVVNGIYDWATTQAIHNFQALHWDAIIKPWLGGPSKISPNTTGRTRQMTTQALNFIMNCPNDEMYLEDPKIFYKLTEIKNKKEFTADQIMKVSNLLEIAKGVVLGAEVMGK